MKKLIGVLAVVVLAGCAKEKPSPALKTIDPQFIEYIEEFTNQQIEKTGEASPIDLGVGFSDLEAPRVGVCRTFQNSAGVTKDILIDRSFWELADNTQREILMFHELGHCVLDLDHLDARPHIMNSFIMGSWTYKNNRDTFLLGLFEGVYTFWDTFQKQIDLTHVDCLEFHKGE